MTEKISHSEIQALLPAFGMNVLSPEEQQVVEKHLEAGCRECNRLVAEYQLVVGALSLDCTPETPPAHVKQNLLSQLPAVSGVENGGERLKPAITIVRGHEKPWQPLFPGIEIKTLFMDPQSGYRTALVKMAAGSCLPRHRHHGDEMAFVVEGSCVNDNILFTKGDFRYVESGCVDEPTETKSGCALFVRFLEVEFYP